MPRTAEDGAGGRLRGGPLEAISSSLDPLSPLFLELLAKCCPAVTFCCFLCIFIAKGTCVEKAPGLCSVTPALGVCALDVFVNWTLKSEGEDFYSNSDRRDAGGW